MKSELGLLQLFRWVGDYALQSPLQLGAVGTMMLAHVVLGLLRPWPVVLLIDHVLMQHRSPEWVDVVATYLDLQSRSDLIPWLAGTTVLIFLLEWAVGVVSQYANTTLGQRITYDVAADLFRHLQQLSLRFHTRNQVGDSIRRVTNDCGCVTAILQGAILPFLTSCVTLGAMAAVMMQINAALTFSALFVMPLMIIAFRVYSNEMLERAYLAQEQEGKLYTVVEQTFSAIPAVKAFSREDANEALYRRTADNTLVASLNALTVQLKFKVAVSAAITLGTAILIWFGAQAVLQNQMTAGAILIFLSYLVSLYSPIESIMYTGSAVQSAGGNARRVLEVLRTKREVRDKPHAIALSAASGRVTFEGVGFAYDERHPTLRDISFEAQPGETVALVGPTGAGKSTLVSLIPRFFDPTAGRVLIDGHDLREVQLASVRRQVALVLQEPFLFPLSVAENIAYGRPDASVAEVEAAARAANAHEFICRLTHGYDTVLGERGATLSGGERQRLSIARALLKDAPILILDEPTSALDAATEAQIMEALQNLMRARTTFVIAHRIATVRHANRILVLQEGALVETGTHNELTRKNGLYSTFVGLQSALPAS